MTAKSAGLHTDDLGGLLVLKGGTVPATSLLDDRTLRLADPVVHSE